MTDPLHVAPGIVGFLDAPNHVRIRAIRTERWIGFGRARRVVEHLGALCEYPPSTRPPGLAIYGHSGMGKTMLVEKFRRDHPPAFNSAVGFETSPVLAISLTSRPTERRVYAQLLMALGVSVNERATLLELEIKAIRLLKDSMVRVLVFDEVHNLLAGSPREQRVILQLFRHLSNELKASLVCLGVADARDAIAGDVQLARRLDQLVLPRWKGDEEFQEMVTAILRSLPLKRPSVLSAQGLRHLVRIADGITARVFGVLNELAIDAVETGAECISDTVIETWKPAIEKEAAFGADRFFRVRAVVASRNEARSAISISTAGVDLRNQFAAARQRNMRFSNATSR